MIATASATRAFVKIRLADMPQTVTRLNTAPTPHAGYGMGAVRTSLNATVTAGRTPNMTGVQPGFKVTPTGPGSSSIYPFGMIDGTMSRLGWARGDTVTVVASIWQQGPQTGTLDDNARSITIGVKRGDVISYAVAASAQADNGAAAESRLRITYTIPADADDIFIRLVNGSSKPTEPVWWNYIMAEKTSVWRTYFDGDSTDVDGAVYDWVGEPGNSASTLTTAVTAGVMTLYRTIPAGGRTLVAGMQNVPRAADVIVDPAVPLNRAVSYVLDFGGGYTVTSNPVTVASDLPLLTHPVTGETAECWIQSWEGRTADTPHVLVDVPGRADPIVLVDVERTATSTPVLWTRIRQQEAAVDRLLALGEPLLLRALCDDVPDAYMAITQHADSRITPQSRSGARSHALSVREMSAAAFTERAKGQTLGDLARALPGQTLGDPAALMPGGTLLDIAGVDWAYWGQS